MLEQKQGQFWNLHRIPNKTSLFSIFFYFYFFGLKLKKSNCNFYSKIFPQKIRGKSGLEVLCEI